MSKLLSVIGGGVSTLLRKIIFIVTEIIVKKKLSLQCVEQVNHTNIAI